MVSNEQIEKYCKQMTEEKSLHKANTVLNADIKQALIDADKVDASSGNYSVHLETRVSESFNEDKAMTILKAFWESKGTDYKCPFIRTVEVLDMDSLEVAMYHGEIPEEVLRQLDSCRTKKETKALTFKIAKEK